MNACFLMGQVQTDIDFKFIMNGNHDAIAIFFIQLIGKNELIKILAYDSKADYCLRKLNKGDTIFLEGTLVNKKNSINVIVKHIYKNDSTNKKKEEN